MENNAKTTLDGADYGAPTCPRCEGRRVTSNAVAFKSDGEPVFIAVRCYMCNGSGELNTEQQTRYANGRRIRNWRFRNELTERAAAKLFQITALELGRAEVGLDDNAELVKLTATNLDGSPFDGARPPMAEVIRQLLALDPSEPALEPSEEIANGWVDSRGRP